MSKALIQPYLNFGGRCEEAIEFYRTTIGAEVLMLMRFKDAPMPPDQKMVPPDAENKVMHATLRIGDSIVMASDGQCTGSGPKFEGFNLSFTAPDEAEANRVFHALTQGGKVDMPIGQTFWSPCFGMVTDRFGLGWMVTVPMEMPA
jgi:PhnB protein